MSGRKSRKAARTAEVIALSYDARLAVVRQHKTRWSTQTVSAVLAYPDGYQATPEEWADFFRRSADGSHCRRETMA
jgi:hypothetical protein